MKTFNYTKLLAGCLLGISFSQSLAQMWTTQSPATQVDLYTLTLVDSMAVWTLGRNDDSGISDNYSRTTDQGAHWVPGFMSSPSLEVHAAHAFSKRHLLAVGKVDSNPETGFVAETFDGGLTWGINRTFPQPLLGLFFADSLHGCMVGRNSYIATTDNGGISWQSQQPPVSRDLHGVLGIDSLELWAVGDNGTLIHSRNGGVNWAVVFTGTNRDLHAITFFGRQRGWIAGANGTLLSTTDSGATWQAQHSGTGRDLHAVDFVSPSEGWAAGDNGTVIHSVDGGLTWQMQASGTSRDILDLKMWSAQLGWFCGDKGTIHIYGATATALGENSPLEKPDRIYPNPLSKDRGSVVVVASQPAQLTFRDLNGRKVGPILFCPEGETMISLDKTHLVRGIYLYSLQAGPAILARGKLWVH